MFVLNDQIGFNLYRVALLFRRELIHALKAYDLTPEQWQILAALWEKRALTQSQIIELTLQDAPSASRTVARMQRKKFLKKSPSETDKRASIVTLTKHGVSLHEIIPKMLSDHFKAILNEIPNADQQTLLRIIKELRQVLGDKL